MWHSGRIEQSVAISQIERWQSAELKGGNQPIERWQSISQIERWQSAELEGGNQPN
jgi:hypothetical protein